MSNDNRDRGQPEPMKPLAGGSRQPVGLPSRESARKPPVRDAGSNIKPVSAPTPAHPLRAAVAPGISGRRPSLSGAAGGTNAVRQTNAWKCSVCGKMMGPEAISSGTGLITDGRMWCVDCFKGVGRKKAITAQLPTKPLIIAGAGVLLLLGLLAIPFPAPVMFVTLILGGLTVVAGTLAFNLSSLPRLLMVLVGLIGLFGSIYGISCVNEAVAVRESKNQIDGYQREFEELLAKNAYSETLVRLASIDRAARNPQGLYLSADAQSSVEKLQKLIDEWVRKNFGNISEEERRLLDSICSNYSMQTAAGIRRLRSLSLVENHAQLSAVMDVTPAPEDKPALLNPFSSGDPARDEVQRMAVTIMEKNVKLESIEIKPMTGTSETELKEGEPYKLDRATLAKMRQGVLIPTDPAPAVKK